MNCKKLLLPLLITGLLSLFFWTGCKKEGGKENQNDNLDSIAVDRTDTSYIDKNLDMAKTIFYSLPSPTEISTLLLDNKDAFYDESLLNPLNNAEKYSTDLSQSLNLGIYSADLSYAGIFQQNQTVVNYMATAKKLAENLGILNVFDEDKVKEIEENFNNRDKIMNIISEAYMESDAYLKENNREEIATLIMIGGWIEGIYLACSIAEKNNYKDPKIISSILEQDLSLDLLVQLLDEYKNSQLLSKIRSDIDELYQLYQNIETDVRPDGNLTTSTENLKKIKDTFTKIRNKYVKMF